MCWAHHPALVFLMFGQEMPVGEQAHREMREGAETQGLLLATILHFTVRLGQVTKTGHFTQNHLVMSVIGILPQLAFGPSECPQQSRRPTKDLSIVSHLG